MGHDTSSSFAPVAIVGVGAIFPGRTGRDGFWRDIVTGADSITDIPPTHWLIDDYYDPDPSAADKTYCRRGGFISPVDFDPMEFGVPPSALPATDTAQLIALVVAKQVLEEAERMPFAEVDRSRTSVILGVASATELVVQLGARLQRPVWLKGLREAGVAEADAQAICDRIASNYVPWQESSFPGLLGNVVAGRIANRLDLGGSNYVTDAACAGSFSALQAALNELHIGQSDLVLSGGVDALNDILMYMCFSKTPAFSPSGDCRPFSDNADGTLIGEGIGMFALRRLADAERDGNAIYAVIRGIGSSSDGRSTSVYAPRSEGQLLAMNRGYEVAGYGPRTVELVEAHGTATKAGDAAEFEGLRRAFEPASGGERQWCALGSVKSQIGHTKAAAGAAGLFKAVMALHHKVLPPTIKVERPNPSLNVDESPFYINTETRPWIRGADHPRRASVSSFGFGGTNFHVTVEEYLGDASRPARTRVMPEELALFSARSGAELIARLRNALGECADDEECVELARRSQLEFDAAMAHRLAISAGPGDDFREMIDRAIGIATSGQTGSADRIFYASGEPIGGRVGFLFPGQGSQYVNMGADLAMAFDSCRQVWDDAATLEAFAEESLHRVVFPPPAFDEDQRNAQRATLTEMANAQPAIGAVGLSHLALLDAMGLRPDAVAGHSYGEVTALHAAGVFDRGNTLAVARRRGLFMTEAAAGTAGAMIAVTAGRDVVEAVIRSSEVDVVLANDNSPQQAVLSGALSQIEKAEMVLREAGYSSTRLPVATAFHSPIVEHSREPFAAFLDDLSVAAPTIPVYANATARPYPKDPVAIRRQLADQLAQPVRFREILEAMHDDGVRVFVEVGPGAVLTGLVGKCLGDRPHVAINLDRKEENGLIALWRSLGQLAVSGLALDFEPLWEGLPPVIENRRQALPHAVRISGANYGKPYPPIGGVADLPKPNPSEVPGFSAPAERSADPAAVERSVPDDRWIAALEAFQRETAETHRQFQASMAESHQAFLRLAQSAMQGIAGNEDIALPQAIDRSTTAFSENSGTPLQTMSPTPPVAPAMPESREERVTPQQATAEEAGVSSAAPTAALGADIGETLLRIVSERTGYSIDMLRLDMELEAELGIDSIKQVEILSTLQDAFPDLPEIEPARLSQLRSLAQIVAFVEEHAGVGRAAGEPPANAPPPIPTAPAEREAEGIEPVLLEIVAEKTGYPLEMLNLDIDLEAGLGIDSIKQVEILSAFQDRIPGLPEIEPAQLAGLRTLRQIAGVAGRGGDRGEASRPTTTASTKADTPAHPLSRYVPVAVESPPAGFAMSGLRSAGLIAVTPSGGKVDHALVEELRSRGFDAALCDRIPPEARAVICLAGLAKGTELRSAEESHLAALDVARQVALRFSEQGGVFVTVQDTGGDFGLETDPGERAWQSGYSGLAKTMALESPAATVKAIDLGQGRRRSATLARALADELLSGGPETEVGLGPDNRRVTIGLRHEARGNMDDFPLKDGDVLVVSGGARGIAAKALEAIANRRRLRIALLGRTRFADEDPRLAGAETPAALKAALHEIARSRGEFMSPADLAEASNRILASREATRTILRLEELGSEVRYISVDVTQAEEVASTLAELRSDWGAIDGLVHAAGVLADKRIADKTTEQFTRVFSTKVQGLRALLDAMGDDPLRVFCLFSSVSARTGNYGQADYAMANEVLNKVARAEAERRGSDCVVRSINWGPWDGGMVDDTLRGHFERLGVQLISGHDGAEFLCNELSSGSSRYSVEVVTGDFITSREVASRMDVPVDEQTYPFLANHVVKDRPVLPIVLAMEWFMRAARAAMPGLCPVALKDIHAVKGVVLERFPDAEGFTISAAPVNSNGATQVSLELRSEDGVLCYRATAEFGDSDGRPVDSIVPDIDGTSGEWRWTPREVYDGKLFHGPAFQVIRELEGISADGGSGVLEGTLTKGWSGGPWLTDPAAMDGGMQLALLWCLDKTNCVFLPTRIGAYVPNTPYPANDLLRCVFRSRLVGHSRSENDLIFAALDGRLVAELRGVEMYPIEIGATASSDALQPAVR